MFNEWLLDAIKKFHNFIKETYATKKELESIDVTSQLVDYTKNSDFESFKNSVPSTISKVINSDKWDSSIAVPTGINNVRFDVGTKLVHSAEILNGKRSVLLSTFLYGSTTGIRVVWQYAFDLRSAKVFFRSSSRVRSVSRDRANGTCDWNEWKEINTQNANMEDLEQKANKEDIPKALSQLTNDTDFISQTIANLNYLKTDYLGFFSKGIESFVNYQGSLDYLINEQGAVYVRTRRLSAENSKTYPDGGGEYLVITVVVGQSGYDGINQKVVAIGDKVIQKAFKFSTSKIYHRQGVVNTVDVSSFGVTWEEWKAIDIQNVNMKDLEDSISQVKAEIPNKVSQLENDSVFKTEVEIQEMINNASSLKKEIVDTLPQVGKEDIIYLVKDSKGKENNIYLEYLWINGKFELIGSTDVDLSGYAKLEDILASKIVDKYELDKDFWEVRRTDQALKDALGRDMLTLVKFKQDENYTNRIKQAGFETALFYKGSPLAYNFVSRSPWKNLPSDVKNGTLPSDRVVVRSNVLAQYNDVIQSQLKEQQNNALNKTDIKEFTQEELEEAFK